VLSPGFLAFTDQAVVSGCNFLTALLLARTLPDDAFGHYSLAFMVCLFYSSLHRALFTQPLAVLTHPEQPQLLLARLQSLIRAHWVAIPIGAILLGASAWYFFPDLAVLLAGIVYLGCFLLQETIRRYEYAARRLSSALSNDLISYGGQLVLLAMLAAVDALTAATAFIAMALSSLAAFFISLYRTGPIHPDSQNHLSVQKLFNEHWPLAKWLMVTTLAVWGAVQVYPFLMAPLGPVAVAAFSACRNPLNALGLVVQSVSNYLPIVATSVLHHGGKHGLKRHFIQTSMLAALIGAAFVFAIHWLAGPLLSFLYGGRYDHAASILKILSFGTASSLLGVVFGAYALALHDSRSGFLSNLGASIVTFTIGMWLIGTEGMHGAALGTALSLATAALLQGGFVIHRLSRMPN